MKQAEPLPLDSPLPNLLNLRILDFGYEDFKLKNFILTSNPKIYNG